jgi:hypothetical protein
MGDGTIGLCAGAAACFVPGALTGRGVWEPDEARGGGVSLMSQRVKLRLTVSPPARERVGKLDAGTGARRCSGRRAPQRCTRCVTHRAKSPAPHRCSISLRSCSSSAASSRICSSTGSSDSTIRTMSRWDGEARRSAAPSIQLDPALTSPQRAALVLAKEGTGRPLAAPPPTSPTGGGWVLLLVPCEGRGWWLVAGDSSAAAPRCCCCCSSSCFDCLLRQQQCRQPNIQHPRPWIQAAKQQWQWDPTACQISRRPRRTPARQGGGALERS